MALEFFGIRVSNCDSAGISIAHGTDAKFNDVAIVNCREGIVERNPPSVLEQLGLPPETPPEVVLSALNILKEHAAETVDQKVTRLKCSAMGPFLQNAANATTTAANLVALSTSMYAEQAIDLFRSLMLRK